MFNIQNRPITVAAPEFDLRGARGLCQRRGGESLKVLTVKKISFCTCIEPISIKMMFNSETRAKRAKQN